MLDAVKKTINKCADFLGLSNRFKFKMSVASPRALDYSDFDCQTGLIDVNKLKVLFNFLFQERSGYICEIDRADPELAKKNIFLTYGEILPEGLDRLFQFVQPTDHDSIVDLGSGTGKVVMQSYLCTPMKCCYGVEIDGARHRCAQEALEDLELAYPELMQRNKQCNKIIELDNCNILDFDFSKVTLIFSNATCFGPNLMAKIAQEANNNPKIRAIMTTHKMEGLEHLTRESLIEIETSWHVPPNKSNCYVYTR